MIEQAYLSGVLHGDGWCTEWAIGLRSNDLDFAQAFSLALNTVHNLNIEPRQDERGYWLVRTSNKTGQFTYLTTYEPADAIEQRAWLRGLFDSEGNANLSPAKISENAFDRRVAFYSTNTETLDRASLYLESLDIHTKIRKTKNSEGHKGTKTVYELRVAVNQASFARFADLVGSNLIRKQTILDAIPKSYKPDLSAHCREAQLKGAAAKHQRTMEVTLPKVVEGIRELMQQGIKPTQRNCRIIPGYVSIQRHISQADLVALTKQDM